MPDVSIGAAKMKVGKEARRLANPSKDFMVGQADRKCTRLAGSASAIKWLPTMRWII